LEKLHCYVERRMTSLGELRSPEINRQGRQERQGHAGELTANHANLRE